MKESDYSFIKAADRNNYSIEGEPEIEKLKGLMKEMAEKLKKDGIPVNDYCRIDENAFQEVYSQFEISKDLAEIKKLNEKYHPGIPNEKINDYKLKEKSEQFEVLKTVIFNKFMGEDNIIVRSSAHDDYKKCVDNIFVNKQTGDVICAFDEVGDVSGEGYCRKRKETLDKNKKDGVYLDYGIKVEKGRIALGRDSYIPIFYLALSENLVEKGIQKTGSSLKEKTENDVNLFKYFVRSLQLQISLIALKGTKKDLAERIKTFEKMLINAI